MPRLGQTQHVERVIMYDSIKSFKCKLSLWVKQLTADNVAHFSSLHSLSRVESQRLKDYSDILSRLLKEFERRLEEFRVLAPQFSLFATPFAVEVDDVSEEVQMEVLDLQCDTVLKQKYTHVGVPDFYKFLPREKFPKLVSDAARHMAMFGSTYVCEQFFSSMKINKSVLRSRLTDKHLRATLRLATTHDFRPNVDSLVSAKRSQLSGQSSS